MAADRVDVLAVMRPATKRSLLDRAADYDKGGEFARGKAAGLRSAVEEIERDAPAAGNVSMALDAVQTQLDRALGIGSMPEFVAARAAVAELVECYDAMLARWWSNATEADRQLGNRAGVARERFAGKKPSPEPFDYELGERRRDFARMEPQS